MSSTGRGDRRSHEEEHLQLCGNLPSDIILDILSRLPLKSLSNFRWVCKTWFNAISNSPRFAKSHYMTNKTSPCVVLCSKNRSFDLVDHQVFDNHQISTTSHKLNFRQNHLLRLLGSANGLLCFTGCLRKGPIFPLSYCICNPITLENVMLPRPPKTLRSHRICGFGFDSTSDKYKVIGIIWQNGIAEAEVYTLGSGHWRRIGIVPYMPDEDAQRSGFFVNGFLHWVSCIEVRKSNIILSFNVSTEEFGIIQLPPSVTCASFLQLGVLEERLCISDLSVGDCVEIWMMKSYGLQESWTKEYVLRRSVLYQTCIGEGYQVAKLRGGELLLSGGQKGRLGYYEPETKLLWYIKIQNDATGSDRDDWEPIIFYGCLFSPKSIEGSRKRLRSETSLISSRSRKTLQNGTSS